MSGKDEDKTSGQESRIESHLKKVYQEDMDAPMSDKLAALVEQLRKKGSSSHG